MTTTRARLVAPQRIELVDQPLAPTPEQLVIRNLACGLCHSEKEPWLAGQAMTMGHEPVGEIVEIGGAVNGDWRVGQRVTGYWSGGCGTYSTADPARVVPVPDGVPTEHALGEVLACLVTCARGWTMEAGADLALVGCGFMGVLSMALVKHTARTLIAVDLQDERLAFAQRHGAHHIVRADQDPVAQVRELTDGRMCQLVTEASGAAAGLDLAVQLVGGFRPLLNLISYYNYTATLHNLREIAHRAVEIRTPHPRYAPDRVDELRIAMTFAARGAWDLDDAITHRWPLAQADAAYRVAMTGADGYLKGVIVMPDGA